jgi:carbamoyl-phosphate synthase large subunit
MKDDIPYFTEVNARFGGGLPLGIAAGVDSPRWLLALAAGLPIEIPPVGTYKTGLYMTRFDDSFFLTEEEYAHSSSRRL